MSPPLRQGNKTVIGGQIQYGEVRVEGYERDVREGTKTPTNWSTGTKEG